MKHSRKWLLAMMTALLMSAFILPVAAQDGAGEGGLIIEGTFSDPVTFNPLYCQNTACSDVLDFLFPDFIGINYPEGTYEVGSPNSIVTNVEVSEDGNTYTYTLRDDYMWSDGTPITSADYLTSWELLSNPDVGSDQIFLTATIESVEAPDAQTLVVTYTDANCTALDPAINIVPSHIFSSIEPSQLAAAEYNTNPTVTAGIMNFGEYRADERTTLVPNPNFVDAALGFVSPTGYVRTLVPDQTVLVEQFLAGETTIIENPPVNRRSDIREMEAAGEAQIHNYGGVSWDYLGLNHADPTNPQNGLDESGNPIDQGHHPFFGDVRVRKAIAYALDVDSMVEAAVFGEGTRMASNYIPGTPAYNTDLVPYNFDAAQSLALLAEAGFVDDDNDPSTPLVATEDALYAEPGTPFVFDLVTNEGNTRRTAIGTIVQAQLAEIGIQVEFRTMEFTALLEFRNNQTYDAFILGWVDGFPSDPDQTQLFSPESDVLGTCCNFTSYHNAEMNTLMDQALNLPGCDVGERNVIYKQIQEIMYDDLPYVFLFSVSGMDAAVNELNGWEPSTGWPSWNIDRWKLETQ